MEIFTEVPEGTVAHERAADQLQHVRKTLAYDLRSEAMGLMKGDKPAAKNIRLAHARLSEALELNPDDAESKKLLADVEKTARERKVELGGGE